MKPNCKDSHTTYFADLDDNEISPTYTKKELSQIEDDYRQEQKQQYANRMVEKFDRLAKYSLDNNNKKTYQEYADRWSDVVKNSKRQLTREEKGAIIKYKSFDSYRINEILRNCENVAELSLQDREFVNNIDKALEKITTYKGDLIRTINFNSYSDKEQRIKQFLNEFTIGEQVSIGQYWSTSKEEGYDPECNIKIYIQNSQEGKDISTIGLDEQEVLYERNSLFYVVNKINNNGVWYILLEEINDNV